MTRVEIDNVAGVHLTFDLTADRTREQAEDALTRVYLEAFRQVDKVYGPLV